MRVFNRLVMIVVFAALLVGGVFAVIYSIGVLGYSMSSLQKKLNLQSYYRGLKSFVNGVAQGSLNSTGIAILVALAIIGLILLILELKPRTPRRVRMQQGTYITRGTVSDEVEEAADQTDNVLESSVRVKAKRRPGAVVNLRASTRRGENQRQVQGNLRDAVQSRLASVGVPLGRLKIRLNEADPRGTGTRVR